MSDVPMGYRMSEVGVIPSEWEVKQIKDVCKLINGRGFKPHEWRKEGFPIIRIQNLNGSEEYNYYQGEFSLKIVVEYGQLLFAWSGSRGTSFGPHIWNGQKGLLNYHTWKVNINEANIEKTYFYHALKRLTKKIEEKAHGASALVHTQKWEMEGFEIPLPHTKAEQQAISSALSDVDALITALDQLTTKKRNIKQGAMQQLLTGKKRLPGFSGEWEVKKLGKITKILVGKDLKEENCSSYADNIFKYPVYSNTVDNEGLYGYYNIAEYQGDSLSVVGRGVGLGTAFKRNGSYGAIGRLLLLFPDINVDTKYLCEYINHMVKIFEESSGIPQLTGISLAKYKISLPPTIEEQQAIAQILTDMDTEIESLKQKRNKYKAIKQGMMQELLTGKTRLL